MSLSLARPLDIAALEFRIGDSIRFTKNLVKLNEIFSTRFGRCGRELVPDASPDPIVFPMKGDKDRFGDRLYALAANGIDLTEQSFAEYSRLLRLADAEETLERAHRPLLVGFIQSLLSDGSRTTLRTYPTYAAASLNLDYGEIWRLILLSHQIQNSVAKLSYLRDFVTVSQSPSFPVLDAYIGEFNQRQALCVAALEDPVHKGYFSIDVVSSLLFVGGLDPTVFGRVLQRITEEPVLVTTAAAILLAQEFARDHLAGKAPSSSVGSRALLAAPAEVCYAALAPSVAPAPYVPRLRQQLPAYDKKADKAYCPHCWSKGYKNLHRQAGCRYYKQSQQSSPVRSVPSPFPRSSGPVDPSAMVAAASAPFSSSVEQGAALMKSMQMYYDHANGYSSPGAPSPSASYPAILPSTYVLRIDDPDFYVLDESLAPTCYLIDGGFVLGSPALSPRSHVSSSQSSVPSCSLDDPVFYLLDGGFALGPVLSAPVEDPAVSSWRDPIGLVDLPVGAFPSMDDLVSPLDVSFSGWCDPVGLPDLPSGSFPSLDDEVVPTMALLCAHSVVPAVDIWCDPGGLSEDAYSPLDDSVNPTVSQCSWDSDALDAALSLSRALPYVLVPHGPSCYPAAPLRIFAQTGGAFASLTDLDDSDTSDLAPCDSDASAPVPCLDSCPVGSLSPARSAAISRRRSCCRSQYLLPSSSPVQIHSCPVAVFFHRFPSLSGLAQFHPLVPLPDLSLWIGYIQQLCCCSPPTSSGGVSLALFPLLWAFVCSGASSSDWGADWTSPAAVLLADASPSPVPPQSHPSNPGYEFLFNYDGTEVPVQEDPDHLICIRYGIDSVTGCVVARTFFLSLAQRFRHGMWRDVYGQLFWDEPPVHSVDLYSLYTTYMIPSELDGRFIFFDHSVDLVLAQVGLDLFGNLWYVYPHLRVAGPSPSPALVYPPSHLPAPVLVPPFDSPSVGFAIAVRLVTQLPSLVPPTSVDVVLVLSDIELSSGESVLSSASTSVGVVSDLVLVPPGVPLSPASSMAAVSPVYLPSSPLSSMSSSPVPFLSIESSLLSPLSPYMVQLPVLLSASPIAPAVAAPAVRNLVSFSAFELLSYYGVADDDDEETHISSLAVCHSGVDLPSDVSPSVFIPLSDYGVDEDDADEAYIPSIAAHHSGVELSSDVSPPVLELLSVYGVDDDDDGVVHIPPMVPNHSECDSSSDVSHLPHSASPLCLCSRLVCTCVRDQIPLCLRPYAHQIVPHFSSYCTGFFKILGDSTRLMLGESRSVAGEVGVFADASAVPSRRPGLRTQLSLLGVAVFEVGDQITPYAGPRHFSMYEFQCVHGLSSLSSDGIYPPNRYLWESDVYDVLIDGSPNSLQLSYSSFLNEGFQCNNCIIDHVPPPSVLPWIFAQSTILHVDELLAPYGHPYWLHFAPVGSDLRQRAADYYFASAVSPPRQEASLFSLRGPSAFILPVDSLDFLAQDLVLSSLPSDIPALPVSYAAPVVCPVFHYDNATSVSVTNHQQMLLRFVQLVQSFTLGGVGSGVVVTHCGYLRFLPHVFSLCYYSLESMASLVSLGYIQLCGGSYATEGRTHLVIRDVSGGVIDRGVLGANRLTPVTASLVQSSFGSVVVSAGSPVPLPLSPCVFPSFSPPLEPTIPSLFPLYPNLDLGSLDALMSSVFQDAFIQSTAFVGSATQHVSREQRLRCDRVEVLHFLSHASDDVLCAALDTGAYSWANLTAADVRLNRRLRGPCISCLQGKFHNKSMPPSDTPPATFVGEKITIDTQELRVRSAGGNTYYVDSCDEFSSDFQVTPVLSLKASDLFRAIMSLIHVRYNAYGHKVKQLISDPLPALSPVVDMLGAVGILLTLVPPGQHAQRVERSVGFLAGRRRAVYASIPFYLPPQYSLYGRIWVADTSNGLPSLHSSPSCADILVTGRRRETSELGFGHVCMVSVSKDKRRREASVLSMFVNDVHRSEVGVCLGYSRSTPGAYDFLLENGEVAVRSVLSRVNLVPFGWVPKKVLLPVLDLPSVYPDVSSVSASPIAPQDVLHPLVVDPSLVPSHVSGPASDQFLNIPSVLLPSVPSVPSLLPPPVPSVPPIFSVEVVPVVVPLVESAAVSIDSVPVPALRRSTRVITPRNILSLASVVRPISDFTATVDVQRVDEYTYDQAMVLLGSVSFVSSSTPLPSSARIPIPSTKCKEVPLYSALRVSGPDSLIAPTAGELDKQQRLGALGRRPFDFLPAGAVSVDGHCLYKVKADNRHTCRIAAMGDRLPAVPTQQTFASVVSDGAKFLSIAAMQAYCEQRGEPLYISDADVVGGFLHIPLNAPMRMFLHLPRTLPHPLAGKYLEIFHAIYGLRESNRLFSLEMTRVITKEANFLSCPAEPQQFVCSSPGSSGLKCIASVTVDDVLVVTNSCALRDSLFRSLTDRFGPLTINLVSTLHTGIQIVRLSNGGVLLTQDDAISRAASLVGVSSYAPVPVPTDKYFFLPEFSGDETVSVDSTSYSSVTGKLVQFMKTRHDVRLFVSYLCSFNHAPLEGHFRRALHILRYLASTPGYGPVFKANVVQFVVFTDSAYGVFRDGFSSSAALFCVGVDNAPFHASAKAQTEVATCPMTAEYYAAAGACKWIMHFRQLFRDLGWSSAASTVMLRVDNCTMISLVRAPQVPVKSRHIEQQHHYIRLLHEQKIIDLVHVPAPLMRANLLSKYLPPASFIRERDCMFQRSCFVPYF